MSPGTGRRGIFITGNDYIINRLHVVFELNLVSLYDYDIMHIKQEWFY